MTFRTKEVIVVPYQAIWKEQFEYLASQVLPIVKDVALGIEHVGSTSIKDCYAKPVIDADIIIRNHQLTQITAALEANGYTCRGDLGIPGRYAFSGPEIGFKYHLYVCIEDSNHLLEHLLLRNHLRKNDDYRHRYSALKQQLSIQYRFDIDSYIEGKSALIQEILNQAKEHTPIIRPLHNFESYLLLPHGWVNHVLPHCFPCPYVIELHHQVIALIVPTNPGTNEWRIKLTDEVPLGNELWINELVNHFLEQATLFQVSVQTMDSTWTKRP
jgi:GrpB-like predicted nucleotidyltransferase (UPF0157 family)